MDIPSALLQSTSRRTRIHQNTCTNIHTIIPTLQTSTDTPIPSVQNPKSNNDTKKMDVRTQIMTQDEDANIPIHGNDQHNQARVLATSSMVRVDKKQHP